MNIFKIPHRKTVRYTALFCIFAAVSSFIASGFVFPGFPGPFQAVRAYAEDSEEYVEYTFPRINTRINIPRSMITFTSSVTSADPNLGRINATADELRIMFDRNNLYLETMPENLSYEIILGGIKKNGVKDYADMNEEELQAAYSSFKAECSASSVDTVYDISTYRTDGNIYFVEDFSTLSNEVTVYSRRYHTVAKGCEISVSLQTKMPSAGDANDSTTYVFNKDAADTVRDIVDRISYEPMKESFADTSMFSELFGYFFGLAVTIGGLGLILWLLIRTTSKPKKRS